MKWMILYYYSRERFKCLVARSHNRVRGSNSACNASTKVTFCNGCHSTHRQLRGFAMV